MPTIPTESLETFDNPNPGRDYTVRVHLPEFTCLCPLTGQPDFAKITLTYVPDQRCVELKSLKLYIWSYRDKGGFHEEITNKIVDDVVTACEPRFVRVESEFNVRGGTYPTVIAEYQKPGWQAAPPVSLP